MDADRARSQGLQANTTAKLNLVFRIWTEFLASIGFCDVTDPFLANLSPEQRIRLIGAFAHAVRQAEFSTHRDTPLASATVRDTIASLSATFVENDRPDPATNIHGKTHRILRLQFSAYRHTDPAVKHQRALTIEFILKLYFQHATPVDTCMGPLIILAFFFAMRSCEYLTINSEQRTKLLRIQDIRFFQERKDIAQNRATNHLADIICITFRDQKNGEKDEMITLSRTTDPIMCPVRQGACIVNRILAIPGQTADSTINTYQSGNHTYTLKSETAIKRVRKLATALGSDQLGHDPRDIGLHSIRSAAAMAMILSGVPNYMVMLIGRWKSDAFLIYIRKQVAEFTKSVSQKMITTTTFFHPPANTIAFTSRSTMAGRDAHATAHLT